MNPNSIIPQSDDRLLSYFVKEAAMSIISPNSPTPKGGKREDFSILIILGLILIVGTEPYKILLRKNIGKMSLSMPRLLLAIFLFIIYAAILIGMSFLDKMTQYAAPLIAGGVFYILFAAIVFFKGLAEYTKGKQKYNEAPQDYMTHLYRGDSKYFKNKDLKRTWLIIEPRFCLLASLVIIAAPAFIHPALMLIGAPLLMTTISFWFNEWYQINNVWDVQLKKVQKDQAKNAQNQSGFNPNGFNNVP